MVQVMGHHRSCATVFDDLGFSTSHVSHTFVPVGNNR